ncbi:MAG: hypothetical protein JWM88_2208 [Verrucomicrobia bacterium]|nr:hypothetical protein [Verrucomicrobiota bacterium]
MFGDEAGAANLSDRIGNLVRTEAETSGGRRRLTGMTAVEAPPLAWEPLPAAEWDAEAAAHLLRRTGWSAPPAEVARARDEGLSRTLERLFPAQPILCPEPPKVVKLKADAPELARGLAAADPAELRQKRREARERTQDTLQEMSIRWLQFAARPENAAFAKWTLFLGDVYVVSAEKVKNAALVWQHSDLIARHSLGAAPDLAKAMSRSPAMVNYLDLNQSRRDAPNENFARELFELFLLGEGHYAESDIKEAARAFTGYRQQLGEFRFAPRQHDAGPKTIFGRTGPFAGDDVIDLAYGQKAAAAFLPRELTKFYLGEQALPAADLAEIGDFWRSTGFNLRALARRFFGSRIFFDPSFRGTFIKSPIQFYLGLMQDLHLDVPPLPRQVLPPFRQMGQMLYYPPNVRGWVGGRSWINSATLAARRRVVEACFAPLREDLLNADEQAELAAARNEGMKNFSVGDSALGPFEALDSAAAADRLAANFLALPASAEFRAHVRTFLGDDHVDPARRRQRLRRAAVILLQSPEYQLC